MNPRPVILITGTRTGIGAFLARHYAEKDWHVVGCSRKPAEWSHPNYEHHLLDVGDEKAVIAICKTIKSKHDRLDAVVNNAGIAAMNHVMLTPTTTVERIFRTNVFGSFSVAREAARLMVPQKRGRIVNFSTVAHPLDLEGEAAYAASKAAIESLTRIMARELAAWNITVNALGPTPIDTDLIRGVPAEKMQKLTDRLPCKSLGTLDEVAHVVDFFLAPESYCITGQVLYLGGV